MKKSGERPCEALTSKEICICARINRDGEHVGVLHEHIPQHRISDEDAKSFLKMLILKHYAGDDSWALTQYMNSRKGTPVVFREIEFNEDHNFPDRYRIYGQCHHVDGWIEYLT